MGMVLNGQGLNGQGLYGQDHWWNLRAVAWNPGVQGWGEGSGPRA